MMMCKIDKNRLLLYLFNELNDRERDDIQNHVHQCEQCRIELERFNASINYFQSQDKPVPPKLRFVSSYFPAKKSFKDRVFNVLRQPFVKFGVACVAIAVLLIVFLLTKRGDEFGYWSPENSWEGPYRYHLNKIEKSIEVIKNDEFYN